MNKKVLILISTLLVVLIIAISIYQTFAYKRDAHKNREFSYLELLSEKNYSIEQQLVSHFNKVDSIISLIIASSDSGFQINKNAILSFLIELENSEHIDIAYILDSTGICQYSTDKALLKNNYSFRSYFKNLKNRNSVVYLAKGITTSKYGIYYSKKVEKDNKFLGALIIKFTPTTFSSEMKWLEGLPSNIKSEYYNGILTRDLILLTTNTNKLYHLSTISESLTKKLLSNRQFRTKEIVNLKLLDKKDTYAFLANHRVLHRKNIYQEDFVLFANPILNGELIQLHIIPHNIFEKYFDNQSNLFENIFKLLSAPFILILLLLLALIISTISYKRVISDLITTSNIKAAEAAVAGIEKDEFLATVTHELRTPLNGVMGITTLLRDTDPSEKQVEYLNMIDSCSTSLLKTINNVLDISKIRSGILTLTKKTFNLPVLLHEVITPIELEIHKKDLSFFFDQSPNIPEWIEGDPERLKQILECFLSNAVKFTDIGSVRFNIDVLNKTDKMCTLVFEISDTGIGIPLDDQERMFETFTQAEMSTTRLYGGMGLGLSIAKSLSDLMSGDLTLKSILGKGSTFSLILIFPLAKIDNNNKENR